MASFLTVFGAAGEIVAGDYLTDDGKLAGKLTLSHVQNGGFVGRLETAVSIEPDGAWTGHTAIGQQPKTPGKGKLSAAQLKALADALAKHELAKLPKVIGSAKPLRSPRIAADGASTTIEITFGKQKTVANFADGVEIDEATGKLRGQLAEIENAIRDATLNAAPKE
jgi:hypothetical protein